MEWKEEDFTFEFRYKCLYEDTKEELDSIKTIENILALEKANKLLEKYQKEVTNRNELINIKGVRSALNGLYYQLKRK